MIEVLRGTPLLSRLRDDQLQRVASHARRLALDEGQWLFSQGDPAERFYLVEQGQMRLFRLSPEGAEKIIEFVAPGQTFAEALMFLNAPRYPVCAAALEPTTLIAIDAGDFATMLRDSVETCFIVLGALSMRLRGLIGEIDNLSLHGAKRRVARYLLAQCRAASGATRSPAAAEQVKPRSAADASALPSPTVPCFVLDVRKGVLASRLSIKPETFSRVIRQLSDEDVIRIQGARITVLAPAVLAALAEIDDLDGG
ncbi:MAG: Crp/Fnr family transcriptional regulator [Chromatiaceae bacterium]|nr:MAG: Crp/Fnr family transcriptional regulator [Chromatiaceae bacterium]